MDLKSSTEKNGSHNDDVSKYYRVVPLAQALLDKHDIPYVGLQYVVEVQQGDISTLDSCYYVCALCSKKMSPTTLIAHVKSVPHRLKFAEHHCPKLNAKYGAIQIKEWNAALVKDFTAQMLKVSESVGKFQMAVCEEHEMNPILATIKDNIGDLEKFRVYQKNSSLSSARDGGSSSDGGSKGGSRSAGLPDFLRQKLQKGLNRDSPNERDSKSSTPVRRGRSPTVVDLDSPSPKHSRRHVEEKQQSTREVSRHRSPSPRHSRRGRSRSPANRRPAVAMPSDRVGGAAAFKKDFDNFYSRHVEKEMYYKKNPESHPDYSSEWKLFWERRYHELASKGINPNKHDFKSEWAVFWNDRMKDIFSSIVENKKESLMQKHKIGKEDLEEKRPISPWEDSSETRFQKSREPDFSVLGTLHSLMAIEVLLGAFGPAIKTLLLKAVSYSSEGKKTIDIFFDTDNLTLIKLSQDKLCSQHPADENVMVRAQRQKAVECCKWLVSEVEKQRAYNDDYLGLDIKEISIKTMGMDTVQIAQQIALSLLKVGKSNVSEDDLQKILLAVSASHTKLMIERQQMQALNNASDLQVSSTTHTIEEGRAPSIAGRPLFPSAIAASQHHHMTNVSQPGRGPVGGPLSATAISQSSRVSPTHQSAASSEKDNDDPVASGALGQLISAYEDDPPRDMDKLSLEDLVNLLSNFKDLSRDEQRALTTYLKRLEATDSKKVTKLRELVQKNAKASEKEKQINEENARKQESDQYRSSVIGGNRSRSPSLNKLHVTQHPQDSRRNDCVSSASANSVQQERPLSSQSRQHKPLDHQLDQNISQRESFGNEGIPNLPREERFASSMPHNPDIASSARQASDPLIIHDRYSAPDGNSLNRRDMPMMKRDEMPQMYGDVRNEEVRPLSRNNIPVGFTVNRRSLDRDGLPIGTNDRREISSERSISYGGRMIEPDVPMQRSVPLNREDPRNWDNQLPPAAPLPNRNEAPLPHDRFIEERDQAQKSFRDPPYHSGLDGRHSPRQFERPILQDSFSGPIRSEHSPSRQFERHVPQDGFSGPSRSGLSPPRQFDRPITHDDFGGTLRSGNNAQFDRPIGRDGFADRPRSVHSPNQFGRPVSRDGLSGPLRGEINPRFDAPMVRSGFAPPPRSGLSPPRHLDRPIARDEFVGPAQGRNPQFDRPMEHDGFDGQPRSGHSPSRPYDGPIARDPYGAPPISGRITPPRQFDRLMPRDHFDGPPVAGSPRWEHGAQNPIIPNFNNYRGSRFPGPRPGPPPPFQEPRRDRPNFSPY